MITASPNLLVAAAMTFMPAAMANSSVRALESPRLDTGLRCEPSNIHKAAASSTVEQRFAAISKLPRGWDGADADPINSGVLVRAEHMAKYALSLPARNSPPNVVPCADGSVQIEWHLRDSRFEMYFEVDGSTSAWWHDRGSNYEIEAEGAKAALLLGQWAVRDAAWPTTATAA